MRSRCLALHAGLLATVFQALCLAAGEPHAVDAGRAEAYTRALLAEARLEDALQSLSATCLYAQAAGLAVADTAATRAALQRLGADLSEQLQADTAAPTWADMDLPGIRKQAEDATAAVWQAIRSERARLEASCGRRVRGARFEPLPALAVTQRVDVTDRLVFTALAPTRTWTGWAEGPGAWEVLRALDLQAFSPWFGWYWERPTSADWAISPDRIGPLAGQLAAQGFPTLVWLEPEYSLGALWDDLGEEMYLHDATGAWQQKTRINNTINVFHPRVRQEMNRWLEALASRYRHDPRILGYELIEEPALRFDVADPTTADHQPRLGGYSKAAVQGFRERLRRRHGTIATLNRRWGAAYASFEAVEPPPTLSRREGAWSGAEVARLNEFQEFRAIGHAECFRQMVAALHHADPGRPVVPQFVTPLFGDPLGGVDLFRMSEAGWDIITFHTDTAYGYLYSIARYAAKPLWNDEYIWSGRVPRGETGEKQLRAQASIELWRNLMWGAQGFVLFNIDFPWNHPKDGGDWNNDLLNEALGDAVPRYAAAVFPQVLRKIPTFFDDLYGSTVVDEGVLLLEPTTSLYTTVPTGTTQWWARRLNQELSQACFRPGFCPERYLTQGKETLWNVRVVLVPPAPYLPATVRAKLSTWVQGGGTLITLGPFATHDAYGTPVAAPLAVSAPGKITPLGAGRHVSLAIQGTPDQIAEAVVQAVSDAVGERAVTATDQRLELMLRHVAGPRYILIALNRDPRGRVAGRVAVRGDFQTITDMTVEECMPVPLRRSAGNCEIPVDLAPGEGRAFILE